MTNQNARTRRSSNCLSPKSRLFLLVLNSMVMPPTTKPSTHRTLSLFLTPFLLLQYCKGCPSTFCSFIRGVHM